MEPTRFKVDPIHQIPTIHLSTPAAITPDGHHLVSGSWDNTLKVWDLESEACLHTLINGPNHETAALDYRNNRILSASSGAWRFLGWRYFDQEANRLRILPAEHAGPLPDPLIKPGAEVPPAGKEGVEPNIPNRGS